jgi:hypothetical protein
MGKEHKKVKFYNTMRYSKNQPYGVEAKILTFDSQQVAKVNLSKPSQRLEYIKNLKDKYK